MNMIRFTAILIASALFSELAISATPVGDHSLAAKDDSYDEIIDKLRRSNIVRGRDVCYVQNGELSEIRRYCAGQSVVYFDGLNIRKLSFMMANVCDRSKPTTVMINGINGVGFCALKY